MLILLVFSAVPIAAKESPWHKKGYEQAQTVMRIR
jgi:hypothetical protein